MPTGVFEPVTAATGVVFVAGTGTGVTTGGLVTPPVTTVGCKLGELGVAPLAFDTATTGVCATGLARIVTPFAAPT